MSLIWLFSARNQQIEEGNLGLSKFLKESNISKLLSIDYSGFYKGVL